MEKSSGSKTSEDETSMIDNGSWLIAMFRIINTENWLYALLHNSDLLWDENDNNRFLKNGKPITILLDQIPRNGFVVNATLSKNQLEKELEECEAEGRLVSRNYNTYAVAVRDYEEDDLQDMHSEQEPYMNDYSIDEEEPNFIRRASKRKKPRYNRIHRLYKKMKLSTSTNAPIYSLKNIFNITDEDLSMVIQLIGDGIKSRKNKPINKASTAERLQFVYKNLQMIIPKNKDTSGSLNSNKRIEPNTSKENMQKEQANTSSTSQSSADNNNEDVGAINTKYAIQQTPRLPITNESSKCRDFLSSNDGSDKFSGTKSDSDKGNKGSYSPNYQEDQKSLTSKRNSQDRRSVNMVSKNNNNNDDGPEEIEMISSMYTAASKDCKKEDLQDVHSEREPSKNDDGFIKREPTFMNIMQGNGKRKRSLNKLSTSNEPSMKEDSFCSSSSNDGSDKYSSTETDSDGGTRRSNSSNSQGNRKSRTSKCSAQDCSLVNNNDDVSEEVEMIPIGTGQTFISTSLYDSIDWSDYKLATRSLLMDLFSRDELATHTLSGNPCPGHKNKYIKPKLCEIKIKDILLAVSRKCVIKECLVKIVITSKCSDEEKMYRSRMFKEKKTKNGKTARKWLHNLSRLDD